METLSEEYINKRKAADDESSKYYVKKLDYSVVDGLGIKGSLKLSGDMYFPAPFRNLDAVKSINFLPDDTVYIKKS
jgi:hypothetical protein